MHVVRWMALLSITNFGVLSGMIHSGLFNILYFVGFVLWSMRAMPNQSISIIEGIT
jgi:hypothetical protein